MDNQKLNDFIKKGLSKGFSSEKIRQKLLESGWSGRDVDEAINSASQQKTNQTMKNPKWDNRPIKKSSKNGPFI